MPTYTQEKAWSKQRLRRLTKTKLWREAVAEYRAWERARFPTVERRERAKRGHARKAPRPPVYCRNHPDTLQRSMGLCSACYARERRRARRITEPQRSVA